MNRSDIATAFLELIPHALYPFQEEALLAWFETKAGVLVCAPTGTGKTLIAEAAVYEALRSGRRLYYTTPLIALTDQKYREFAALAESWGFARSDVGLITGNRRENPDALVRVVVAEILLNHLLAVGGERVDFSQVDAVVMDEFHSFNDPERGIVWELTLALLPQSVRVLLLSATVGNPFEFSQWLKKEHGRALELVTSADRRIPLEFHWVEDKLLTDLLPEMAEGDEQTRRVPALVFCFNRDECWELAERLKGLPLIRDAARAEIDAVLTAHAANLAEGVGPKLRQMLLRGVGVHHAGVLPKHKMIVEELFLRRLVPIVVCTETLAAGINLPARSVVMTTLLKGPHGGKTVIPPATAHQIFGRAGRPQFDTQGHVYAVAHEDDVKIARWKQKYEKIDPNSKDPGIMRARKELERKRPTRRKTEQYWTAGQFDALIRAGAAKLASRAMIPYHVLVHLLSRSGAVEPVRHFLRQRFAAPDRVERFLEQLAHMLGNLAGLGYIEVSEDGMHVSVRDSIHRLLQFRSVDPLLGAFMADKLTRGDENEKILALESVLQIPPVLERRLRIPPELPRGPLQTHELEPELISLGLVVARTGGQSEDDDDFGGDEPDGVALMVVGEDGEERPRAPTMPEMLKLIFEARLPNPEPFFVQAKWAAGAAFAMDCDFYRFVKSADLVKQEGIVLRHLLRLAILAGEFFTYTEDPAYQELGEKATRCCRRVDASYTDRFLSEAAEIQRMTPT